MCRRGSVLSIRRQPNGVSEMSPKLSVEHKEAGFVCRRGSVLSIRRQPNEVSEKVSRLG